MTETSLWTPIPLRDARRLVVAMELFREVRGDEAVKVRAKEILALPVSVHRGRVLRTLRCQGQTGRGPHDMNLSETVLWSLMDLGDYHCEFHPRGV